MQIMDKFSGYPAQQKVVQLLLERGFQVNEEGRVVSGGIEIPHTQIAEEIHVDRRVIDATTNTILEDELLSAIFRNVHSIPSLRDVAPLLGLGVIVITPDDAGKPGILGDVASAIAEWSISIRQAVSDDPNFTEEPRLTIITDRRVPGDLVQELMSLPGVRGVTVF